jgi:hypothetical protein
MAEKRFLKDLKEILHKAQLDCSLEEATDQLPIRLLVYLGTDAKERERILEITSEQQDFTGEGGSKYYRVQFQLLFPFKFIDNRVSQIASLICFTNRMIELPGLEMSEIDNSLFYRYTLLTIDHGLDKTLLAGIIGNIMLIADLLSDTLEGVGSGKTDFNSLLEELVKTLNSKK